MGLLRPMAAALAHRGPDDEGFWKDSTHGIGFIHRRLAVVDLSAAGHQPMTSAKGRYTLDYNGEIYNYPQLRAEVEKASGSINWCGHSDTEILLAGFEAWGIEETIRRAIGMFAFAVWDHRDGALTLGRDRMGEKPLYYGWQNDVLLFGSELKALRAHPAFEEQIDRESLALQLRYGYVPAPRSIYRNIYKLPAGCLLTLPAKCRPEQMPVPKTYWSMATAVEQGKRNTLNTSDTDVAERVEDALRQSISGQMIADVPIGAFLSGGIDSSLVVALMQAQSTHPVRTFTIGFDVAGYNEAEHAKAVAKHLNTNHTELYVTAKDALDVVPKLPHIYDEPFADPSQIPTYLISKLTRQHVTVALSGDGGDELFGGYNRYLWSQSIWNKIKHLPAGLRQLIANALKSAPPHAWDSIIKSIEFLIPAHSQFSQPGEKIHKLAGVLGSASPEAFYQGLISSWDERTSLVTDVTPASLSLSPTNGLSFVEQMMAFDAVSYLPDDVLVKVDRATMAVALESRVPFLDHRVVELAWQIPMSMKIGHGQSKWILRQILDKYVPRTLIERPKMGFSVPLDTWLRGPLRDWAEDLLNEDAMRHDGYLNPAPIRTAWNAHLSGKQNRQQQLWNVLMFQAWLKTVRN